MAFKSGRISASKQFDLQPSFLSIPSKIHGSLLLEPFLIYFWGDSEAKGVQEYKFCPMFLFSQASSGMQKIRGATNSFRDREFLCYAQGYS
jgi:hypothetical protein